MPIFQGNKGTGTPPPGRASIFLRINDLRHQRGDMHIVPTVPVARIYANITKLAHCIEKWLLAQNMSILVLSFTKEKIHTHSHYRRCFDLLSSNYMCYSV